MNHLLKQLVLLFLLATPLIGTPAPVDERDMKAALIYNFSVYTTWPGSTGAYFNVCALEDDEENINPSILESKKINGKSVRVAIIKTHEALNQCQVLFLQDAKPSKNQIKLNDLEKLSVLTIVENSSQPDTSGIISIKLENHKYVFSVNNEAAKHANLTLSSKLLRLAEKVN